MLRILIAPDKFKGSLTSREVCDIVEKGLRLSSPDMDIISFPLADGGDGLLEIISYYTDARVHKAGVANPLGKLVSSRWLLSSDGRTAFVEMAQASGLSLLQPAEYDCLLSSTYGTGQLIGEAIRGGAKEIVIGIGGSATNDGGMGMAAALGYRFLDEAGAILPPCGGNLIRIRRIMVPEKKPWKDIRCRVACDVRNPLCGPLGATRVYAPQKGADPAMVDQLEAGMLHYAEILKRELGMDVAEREGAGAAGGLGAGCMVFLQAELMRGVDLVIEYSGLEQRVQDAEILITGEGKIDDQTLQGKLVAGIAALGRRYNKTVLAICGTLELPPDALREIGITAAFSIVNRPMTLEAALSRAPDLLQDMAFNIGGLLMGPGDLRGTEDLRGPKGS